MNKTALYIDGSADPKTKVGFSAYVLTQESDLQKVTATTLSEYICERIQVQKFVATSSTRLEIEGLLWALKRESDLSAMNPLTVYTDSQCIVGLPGRRARLERLNFRNRSGEKELNNASLYREFFSVYDRLKFQVIKLAGHTKAANRGRLQTIFACVDQCSRKALREHLHADCEAL